MASQSSQLIGTSGAAGENRPKNGIVKTRVIVCPEMCCYCFDVLIGYIQGKKSTNSCMKNYFSNDE